MPIFTKVPYLPNGQVSCILAGEGMRAYENALKSLGIECLYSEPIPLLNPPVKAHVDLAVFQLSANRFLLEQSQINLFHSLSALGAKPEFLKSPLKNGYPYEVPLNCVRIGKKLICNPRTADPCILKDADLQGVSVISVKQGYTKCSVAPVTENAMITDDAGIARAAKRDKLDVLLVRRGSVRLKGYPYGFFGGCCSLISSDTMLFAGDVRHHADCDAILAFLRNYGISPEFLSENDLTDIGSFIPLIEQEVI